MILFSGDFVPDNQAPNMNCNCEQFGEEFCLLYILADEMMGQSTLYLAGHMLHNVILNYDNGYC